MSSKEDKLRHKEALRWARRNGHTRASMTEELVAARTSGISYHLCKDYKRLSFADLCDTYVDYKATKIVLKTTVSDRDSYLRDAFKTLSVGALYDTYDDFKKAMTREDKRIKRDFDIATAERELLGILTKREDKIEMPNAVSVVIKVIDSTEGRGEVIEGSYPAGATTIKHPRLRDYQNNDVLDVTLMVGRGGVEWGEVKWGDVQLRDSAPVAKAPKRKSDPLEGWVKVGTEYFSPSEKLLFETAMNELQHRPVILQAVGDSGYGKTSRFHAWAYQAQMDCLDIHCPTMRDPAEWFGYEEVSPQGTYFAESAFSDLLQRGNGVAVLDEITRVNPLIANALLPVLDFRRNVRIHNRIINVGENLLFGMTANKGLGYTATYEMDAALMRRVDATFEVGAPPAYVEKLIVTEKTAIDEETAEKLIALFNKLREANHDETNALQINTGSAIKIGMLVRGGMTLRQAVQFVSVNTAPLDMRHDLITQVNSELGQTFRV